MRPKSTKAWPKTTNIWSNVVPIWTKCGPKRPLLVEVGQTLGFRDCPTRLAHLVGTWWRPRRGQLWLRDLSYPKVARCFRLVFFPKKLMQGVPSRPSDRSNFTTPMTGSLWSELPPGTPNACVDATSWRRHHGPFLAVVGASRLRSFGMRAAIAVSEGPAGLIGECALLYHGAFFRMPAYVAALCRIGARCSSIVCPVQTGRHHWFERAHVSLRPGAADSRLCRTTPLGQPRRLSPQRLGADSTAMAERCTASLRMCAPAACVSCPSRSVIGRTC